MPKQTLIITGNFFGSAIRCVDFAENWNKSCDWSNKDFCKFMQNYRKWRNWKSIRFTLLDGLSKIFRIRCYKLNENKKKLFYQTEEEHRWKSGSFILKTKSLMV